MTTSARALPASTPRWTWPPARSSAGCTAATARSSSSNSCGRSTTRSPRTSTSTSCSTTAQRKTPAIQRWLTAHPRFALHFTPTSSSWLNLVERWFAELTTKKLRRGAHRTVRELNADIRAWIETWNDDPKPYVWTKTADQILDNLTQYLNRINDSRH